MKFRSILLILTLSLCLHAEKFNGFGLKYFTTESEHFTIHYMNGCGHLAKPVAAKFEELYSIYRNTYNIALPNKTNVVIIDSDNSNGWAFANTNTITLWTHDFDFNLRGSHDWFDDVIAHEYAHIVSINSALKTTPLIPEFRFGFFSHPNEKNRSEVIHSLPMDILPHWFTEGIAQFESSRNGADSWDSHRDMILRTLVLSDKVLSWDHMQVFSGRGDDYEKTYNHGFSLVKYITEKYGYDKVTALLRSSEKITRMNFDQSIREVLGISGRELYDQWIKDLKNTYEDQIKSIGNQVFGKKINKDGFSNFWPRFSSDGKYMFFLSNGKADYGLTNLYRYSFSDTISDKNRIKPIMHVTGFYDITGSGRICYTSAKSKKSVLPPSRGGAPVLDLFTDTIITEGKKKPFSRKTEYQVTFKKDIFSGAFSPDGNMIACAQRNYDKFSLVLTDKLGKKIRTLYPYSSKVNDIGFIYSVDWAPQGHQIAFSYFDKHDRKIAIYDTLTKSCQTVCNTDNDERDPSFSSDGKYLYFSSDRTGIFNIYRVELASGKLEQITNVSGGAFAPSISPDNNKLAYAGYDKDGYSIYLIDNIKPVKVLSINSPFLTAKGITPQEPDSISVSTPRPYSNLPRQLLVVPMLFAEQATSSTSNVNKGVTAVKTGLVFNLFEPLTLSGHGNELGGYFLMEAKHLFNFIDLDQGGLNPDANYDIGVYGITNLLPFTLSIDYGLRGIAGRDEFYEESEEMVDTLDYNIQMHTATLQLTHFIDGKYDYGTPRDQIAIHLFGGFNLDDVTIQDYHYHYNLDKGVRIGLMGTFGTIMRNARMNISPEGLIAKIQYTLNNQYSLKEENSFDQSGQERYDSYLYHEVKGHLKSGMPSPWHSKHDFHIDLSGAAVKLAKQGNKLPSFYLPGAWLPGYSYYFKEIKMKPKDGNDSAKMNYDTLVLTGNAVMSGELSYRFPLWPGLIDKKISFLYLERLYGGINVSGGAGWENGSDLLNFDRSDWLISYGCELRLEAQTFSNYPLAIKLRWDRGMDKPSPIGGNRFSFSLGYDFDNWSTVLHPDYHRRKF